MRRKNRVLPREARSARQCEQICRAKPRATKKSGRDSAEAIVGSCIPEGPKVVAFQVTVSKSTIARTRSKCRGKGIVTQSGRRGGHAFLLTFCKQTAKQRAAMFDTMPRCYDATMWRSMPDRYVRLFANKNHSLS